MREDGFEITLVPRLNPSLCESFGLLGVHCSSCWKTSVSVIARGELGYRRCYEATRQISTRCLHVYTSTERCRSRCGGRTRLFGAESGRCAHQKFVVLCLC